MGGKRDRTRIFHKMYKNRQGKLKIKWNVNKATTKKKKKKNQDAKLHVYIET